MSERVVDDFEAVDIDEHDRQATVVTHALVEGVAQPLVEHGAVGKLGQRIVSGYETELILREPALEALPDLCAEGFQQLREGFVRLNGFGAE